MLALLIAVAQRVEWALLLGLLLVYVTFRPGIAFRAFSETPFMAFTFAALVTMALAMQGEPPRSWRSRTVWLAVLAGLLAGAAALTRHIGFMVPAALGVTGLIGPIRERTEALRVRVASLVAMAVGAGLPLGLWFARYAVLGGSVFGPERPPSNRTLAELMLRLGSWAYLETGVLVLVLAALAIGYHLLEREDTRGWRAFSLSLAGAAVVYAVLHEAGTVASHTSFRMDNPPEWRQFFPGYAVLLVAIAALLSRAKPPEGALRRRWPILALLALPIVLGPLVAGSIADDLTPERNEVDEWVARNTSPDDLIIGWRAWPVRFHTGRPVLQSGMVTEPSVYRAPLVAEFLERFGDHFTGAWLVVPLGRVEPAEVRADYERAGLHLEQVGELSTEGVYHYRGVGIMRVYRVTGWRNG